MTENAHTHPRGVAPGGRDSADWQTQRRYGDKSITVIALEQTVARLEAENERLRGVVAKAVELDRAVTRQAKARGINSLTTDVEQAHNAFVSQMDGDS